ncbi:MAG: hypothetical protein GEU75_02950 [Dehalococcoidia bacterium]|nr:hypothetical protein [Dehalococcoidia bacterium]
MVSLKVTDNTDRIHLALEMQGEFSFSDGMEETARARMADVNGPAILYGVARGIIGVVTGFSNEHRYLLPSVNIVYLAQRQSAREKARGEMELPAEG